MIRLARRGVEHLLDWSRVLACVLLFASPAIAQERVNLKFVNADLDAVVRAIGHYTGRTFVVDPRVKGTLTLTSEKPLNRTEALAALAAALRMQGFAIVEVGGVSRIVPEADAKFQGGAVDATKVPRSVRGDQVITQVFRLQYESAVNVLPVVRPLVPPNNPVIAFAGSNALVVTDYADNLRRIEKIIAAIDVETPTGTQIIPLKHAIASDIALLVMRLTEQQPQAGQAPDADQKVVVVADPVTNSLIVRTRSVSQLRQVEGLVTQLDRVGAAGNGVYVVPLKNASSSELAEILAKVRLESEPGATPRAAPASQQGGAPATPTSIVADQASNSLVISASESIYRQLRSVIDRLDVRRAQVYIEALLVEVTNDRAAEFGIQWLGGLNNISDGSASAIGGTRFGDATQNIVSGAQNLGNLGNGLNIGVIKGQVTIPGLGTITNLNFLARALETQAKGNILATPNILTLDNEEATIVVGENVPFITGQYVTQGAVSPNVNPFQTVERQDVGLTLRVRPQISEGGTIRMSIYQEASAVKDQVNVAGIITTKRSFDTNVLVDDGNIIVLGGLVQDEIANSVEKVPFLGDLPILGNLFRYESRQLKKTNLMLFLRPYVIRAPDDSFALTVDRYDMMRKVEQETQLEKRFALPAFEGPVLPEIDLGQGRADNGAAAPASPEPALR